VRLHAQRRGARVEEPASADLSGLIARGCVALRERAYAALLKLAGRVAVHARGQARGDGSDRSSNAIRLLSSLCAEAGGSRVRRRRLAISLRDLTHASTCC